MDNVSLITVVIVGLLLLSLHVVSIALIKAIQSYSRSLLEERCAALGRAERADEVEHADHKTERAAEALAVLSGLLLGVLSGAGVTLTLKPWNFAVVLVPLVALVLIVDLVVGVTGKVFAEAIVDTLWPVSAVVRVLALPMTTALRVIEQALEWVAGQSSSSRHRPAHLQVEIPVEDDDELSDDEEPDLPESARTLLQQTVALTRTDISGLMTPRSLIVSLPSTVSSIDAAATFRRTGLSRVPLFQESRDDIVGVLYAKDLFARMTEARTTSAVSPREMVRPVLFVPETKNAYELMQELRTQRVHMAIVLDEYGSVAGLVSLEDLLEELVGPIEDEHDVPAPTNSIRKIGTDRFEVDATLSVEDVNEELGLNLPTDGEFQTIGGLVFQELGRLPSKGDRVAAFGLVFTVLEVRDHSIGRLEIDVAPGRANGAHPDSDLPRENSASVAQIGSG